VEDITSIANALCVVLPSFLTTGVQFVAAFTFLSLLNVRLAGVLVLIMPLFLLFSKRYMRRIRLYTSDIRTMDGRVQTHMQEYMRHRVLVSAMEYTPHVKEDLDAMHVDLREKVMRRTDYTLFSRRMIQAGFMGGYMVAFLWGIFGLREGVITFGMMTAFLQLVGQIQRPVLELSHQLPTFIHITTSVDRLAELTNMPLEQQGEAISLDGKVGVRLQGVTFGYEGNRDEVLHDFSCDFRPGSLTAVLGRTGAGKSTLVRIILGLLIPQKGKVEMYNDSRIEPISPLTRCNVAYVPQGNSLVSGTVRSNLLLGNPSASEEQMLKALHTAVADFVLELPDGLDTLCGEGGTAFSEGQAQRIAIARGLLRERSIVLMDEPTAALDVVTEQLLLERLGEYSRHRTLIIVTHHGATAKLCNAVVSVG
jgi:ABC-type multidrug transport system fused ATPase/permease subunit